MPVINHLIAQLPNRQRQQVLGRCDVVDLAFGDVLCVPDQAFANVYFPMTATVSLLVMVSRHPTLELGMIGNEGVLGGPLVLGMDISPLQGQVQGAGTALRMTAPLLRREISTEPALRQVLSRYLYSLTRQLLQTAACNTYHQVEQRLARWLLMSDDRCHTGRLQLTHQLLADMLGVRRSAVTIAAGKLRDRQIIGYARGVISILDRHALEAVSCECYGATAREEPWSSPES